MLSGNLAIPRPRMKRRIRPKQKTMGASDHRVDRGGFGQQGLDLALVLDSEDFGQNGVNHVKVSIRRELGNLYFTLLGKTEASENTADQLLASTEAGYQPAAGFANLPHALRRQRLTFTAPRRALDSTPSNPPAS